MSIEYEKPSVAVDLIVCGYHNETLCVLLGARNREPFIGKWGLLGGYLNVKKRNKDGSYRANDNTEDETVEDAARRILLRDTGIGIKSLKIQPFNVYSDPMRHKENRVVSLCNFVLLQEHHIENIVPGDSVTELWWCPINQLPKQVDVAFDHYKMICDFREELKVRLSTSALAFDLVGREFILPVIRNVYSAVFDKEFDAKKTNFTRYMTSHFNIKATGKTKSLGVGRPAVVYKFVGYRHKLN